MPLAPPPPFRGATEVRAPLEAMGKTEILVEFAPKTYRSELDLFTAIRNGADRGPVEKGLPAIAVSAPEVASMVKAETVSSIMLVTKRNLPAGSMATPAG